MNTIKEYFLDYTIINTGNSDDWVLLKDNVKSTYECHLGNYSTVDEAKKAAILFFMIARPEVFHASLYYRMNGRSGQYGEYSLLKKQCKKEGIDFPEEIKKTPFLLSQIGNISTYKDITTYKDEMIGFDKDCIN
jgi:hypothetical protein